MTEPDPYRENADLIRAMEERPLTGGVQVPERVIFDLEAARETALRARAGRPPQQQRPSWAARHPGLLRLAAILVLLGAVTWMLLPGSPGTARVVVTSPGDAITSTRPTIAWSSKDKPGQKYDVWILPAEGDHLTAPTLFVAKGVTSPVPFEQLQPGKDTAAPALQPGTSYRVLICLADAGRRAGVPIPFKVKPAAPAP